MCPSQYYYNCQQCVHRNIIIIVSSVSIAILTNHSTASCIGRFFILSSSPRVTSIAVLPSGVKCWIKWSMLSCIFSLRSYLTVSTLCFKYRNFRSSLARTSEKTHSLSPSALIIANRQIWKRTRDLPTHIKVLYKANDHYHYVRYILVQSSWLHKLVIL